MAAPCGEEKLIWDKFNLEALTVNQMKSFKALAINICCFEFSAMHATLRRKRKYWLARSKDNV
jgi:hypothetical protein